MLSPWSSVRTRPSLISKLTNTSVLILTSYSDRARSRGIPAACVFCIGIVGWAILLGVNAVKPTHTELHVRYFGCICIVSAGYSAIPLTTAWIANNSVHESQRATGLGLLNSLGQCLSIVASFIFPNTEGWSIHVCLLWRRRCSFLGRSSLSQRDCDQHRIPMSWPVHRPRHDRKLPLALKDMPVLTMFADVLPS